MGGVNPYRRADGKAYFEPVDDKEYEKGGAYYSEEDSFGQYAQGRRGSYTPFNTSTNTYGQAGVITLMQESDKSTFMHESSHVWLDTKKRSRGVSGAF